jgi:hypothetical protein
MTPIDPRRDRRKSGAPPWAVNLAVVAIVVFLLAVMVWLAHQLTHASAVIDCVSRGIRTCG